MPLRITGQEAAVSWGYSTAATVRTWTVTRDDGGQHVLVATVIWSDAYNLAQRPLLFVVRHARGQWRWPILTIDQDGDIGPHQIRAMLGPPEP